MDGAIFILVLGGSGFIGRRLVMRLAASDYRVIVPTRNSERVKDLLVLPGVEQVVDADIHDDATLARLVDGVDVVINLVGMLHSRPAGNGERYGPDFAEAHVELPRRVVAACAAHGVRRYLHMSALGAAVDAPSMYLRSKADGEKAAWSNPAVATTVFRPSVVFGEEDRFLNRFASLQKIFPFVPLACADARFQPIYVGDVVQAFFFALRDVVARGRTYTLTGPRVYTLRELVRLAGMYAGCERPIISLPPGLARLQAWMFEHLPGVPLISRDNLDSMSVPNVAAAPPALELGLKLSAIETVAPAYLAH